MSDELHPRVTKVEPSPCNQGERKSYPVYLFGCKLRVIYFMSAPVEIDMVVPRHDGGLCRLIFRYDDRVKGYSFSHVGIYDADSKTMFTVEHGMDKEMSIDNAVKKEEVQEWDWKETRKEEQRYKPRKRN